MTVEPDLVRLEARLVGNVTGNVYALGITQIMSAQKARELYLGHCYLAIPWKPYDGEVEGENVVQFDPADTEIIVEIRANAKTTRFGNDGGGGRTARIGSWYGCLENHPRGTIEIPHKFNTA